MDRAHICNKMITFQYKKLKCASVFSGVLSFLIFVRELPSGMYSLGFQCTLKSITLEVRLV